MSKLLPIITVALVVVSIVISTISLVTVMSVSKKMTATTVTEKVVEEGDIPLTETVTFKMAKPIIATLKFAEDPEKSMNVSIDIEFRVKDTEKSGELITLMTENEGILRDRITKLIKTKTGEDFEKDGFDSLLQQEILQVISAELGTDLIVEVYFANSLTSVK